MGNLIEITDFNAEALDVYARLTEAQLLNKDKPEEGLFIAESPKVVMRALDAGYEPVSILTEDRNIKGEAAEVIDRCSGIPVYTTDAIHKGMNRSYCMTQKISTSAHYLQKQQPVQIADFTIEAFEVPHDGTDNVGYRIRAGEKTFCFVTDLGEITPTAADYIRTANYLVIEANYDEEMLQMGPYPAYLKARIASATGHLSNAVTASFLAENFTEKLKYIWLCHLSKDNNHPELAYKTVELKLREKGITVGRDVQLCALKRGTPSQLYELE